MATTLPAGTSTYDDYLATPDDERYELLEGDLVMVPAPSYTHQRVQSRLSRRLGHFIEEHELGECLNAPLDIVLSEKNIVQPDIVYVSREREPSIVQKDGKVHGAPDLVVEILSPSTAATDRGAKLDLYSNCGVREYWIVDPVKRTVDVFSRQGGWLTTIRTFGTDETLESALLRGLKVRLADIFPA